MRERLACLLAAFREVIRPQVHETDEDEVSKAAFRQWISASKHPPECAGGCRCEGGKT
jgi:hypothetical protein